MSTGRFFATTVMAMLLSGNTQAASRDYISVVGSSTIYPFATVVAEQFGRSSNFKTPKIESTGSGVGIRLFCAGNGVEHPDFANSSRRMHVPEFEECVANGVKDIVEIKIGYDGIVLANSSKSQRLDLARRDIFLALAKKVPNPDGTKTLVNNPYITWKDVNSSLPAIRIEVLGPPPTSGTRDAFVELAMAGGCSTFAWIEEMTRSEKISYRSICHTVREDGVFVESGENDNLIVQKLNANPDALGIFGFSFLDQNSDKVQGSRIDGMVPTFATIADGGYPVSRSLYFYVKAAHFGVIPGMREFLAEFSSDKAWGPEGYLADRGLIPMPDYERGWMLANAQLLGKLDLQDGKLLVTGR